MSLPPDPTRLGSIRDFATWKQGAEHLLAQLDSRIATLGARTASGSGARVASFMVAARPGPTPYAGEVVWWIGAELPTGLLPADGTTVATADYPDLYAALADTYATGDEEPGTFRLPQLDPPATGSYALRA